MKKCVIFKDMYPELSRTIAIFQDIPGLGIFQEKIQDFPGDVGTLQTAAAAAAARIVIAFSK